MELKAIIALLIGGGGIGSMVSAFLTRRTEKDKIEISLLDRAYKEIERLNTVAEDLREQLKEAKIENEALELTVRRLEQSIEVLEKEIKLMEKHRKRSE